MDEALPKGIAKDIKDVAEKFSCPISEVEQIVSTEIHQLEQGAHVKDFVPLLAIKEVKDILRLNRRPPPTRSAIETIPR